MSIEKPSERKLDVVEATQHVEKLMAEWQQKLPEVQVVLGGSLVSGLFVYDHDTKAIDVDARFLTKEAITDELQKKVEEATGLKYRKTIQVNDWPEGMSEGRMVEGELRIPGVPLPLDVEGCIRNEKYVGWARFYKDVLTPEELAGFLEQKRELRHDKAAYKQLKQDVLAIVKERALAQGLVSAESAERFDAYNVALLDPRPGTNNDLIFSDGDTYGIEVTVPELAARCTLGNLDPQHTGGDHTRAAIEDAISVALPPVDAKLVTIRPDLDSLGSMAIFNMRQRGEELTPEILERVQKIATTDTFSRGGWPGARPMPTNDNRWPEGKSELGAIAKLGFDHKVLPAERVRGIEEWIKTGNAPAAYDTALERERDDLIRELESGAVTTETRGPVALVQGDHRTLLDIGYRAAPVVVALNPVFKLQGGVPHAKYTICQYEKGYVDFDALMKDLREQEPGWGGSPTILGSPQGVASNLSIEDVYALVEKNLLRKEGAQE